MINTAVTADGNHHPPFNFYETNKKIFNFPEQIHAIGFNHYFICQASLLVSQSILVMNEDFIFKVNQSSCRLINCGLLTKYDLVVGKFDYGVQLNNAKELHPNVLDQFKNRILESRLLWSIKFLEELPAVARDSDLIQEVMLHIHSASELRKCKEYLLSFKNLKLANQILARLYGSKAFLAGGIIEMIMVFEYFRDIYFY